MLVLMLIYLAFVAATFYRLAGSVTTGKTTKGRAVILHAAYAIAPVLLYGTVFISLVGVEELTGAVIVGEGYARSLPFMIAGGMAVALLSTLVFSFVTLVLGRKDARR
jgi:hypothetical protein